MFYAGVIANIRCVRTGSDENDLPGCDQRQRKKAGDQFNCRNKNQHRSVYTC